LDVDIALSDHPEIVAVCLISPTYDGSDADIPAIAQVCHSHGALLIVDAAWGAFYGLLEKVGFPPRPLALGADIEITSLHKKNLGPSQIAAAFFSHPSMAAHFDVASSIGFETTSIFLPSLGITEHNLREAANGSLARRWVKALGNIEAFREQLSKIHPKCRSIRPSALGSNSGDPGHVLVHVGDLGVIGYDLDRELQKRSVVPEKATRDTVLLLFGPQEAESYERRLEQLAAAIAACPRHSAMKLRASREALTPPTIRARAELSIREALLAPIEQVSLENAANRIAAQVIAPYPPGSALLVPGERIDPVQIDYARAVKKHGGKIRGLSEDISSATLYVVIE
jgi:arginine/lysine/ornithine decarboxylase